MQDVGLPGKLGTEWMSVGGGGVSGFWWKQSDVKRLYWNWLDQT